MCKRTQRGLPAFAGPGSSSSNWRCVCQPKQRQANVVLVLGSALMTLNEPGSPDIRAYAPAGQQRRAGIQCGSAVRWNGGRSARVVVHFVTPHMGNLLTGPLQGWPGVLAGEFMPTYWYAPSVRAIVKASFTSPCRGTSHVELVKAELQP
ncbi:hypothetical protein [Hydrogenophaga intermedia]|jgi:hypothetical protein|uniref:hypothetical protein n=1 Tax=Hydrogenophaga intermedia TaxID=65786 RepID=UPI002042FF86|nr:hypothetical protein [Hydrogenophaga intermedia]MCM3563064.1 hypothetical protein [Hydrogenophaga intermedia]